MATTREQVTALIQYSVMNALKDDNHTDRRLPQRVVDLLVRITRCYPAPSLDPLLVSLCSELRSLGIIETPEQSTVFFQRFKNYPYQESLIIIANVLLVADDSRFNSQIWPRKQRLQAYFERVKELFSALPCQDAARESMVDLLHGQFFFEPGVGDGEPLYLFRDFDTDCIKLISEYYANRLAPLLLHADFDEQKRGFLILTGWIRFHYNQGAIPGRLTEFLNDRLALIGYLSLGLYRHDNMHELSDNIRTILKTPAELPPPYMPAYAQTTLTAPEIGRYNGAISTLHDLIRDPSQYPVPLLSQFESCRTLEEVLPIRFALLRPATIKKAAQLANTIPLHPVHHRAIASAADIMRQCSELSDSEFAENLDAIDSRLSECRILLDSDEHGHVPDYFGELSKMQSNEHNFKFVYWKLQERAPSCIDDESIGTLLQAAVTEPFFSLETPRRLAYLLWPAFNISPKNWSKAYATLVDRIHCELIGTSVRSYTLDLKSQLRWLHQCWECGSLCRLPKQVYMPCNLSGLRIDDAQYCRNPFLWVNSTRGRGWWVGLPYDMTLIDISTYISDVYQMLSLCSYPQRLRELAKIWDKLVQDPSVFPMLFQVLQLNKPEHVQTLRDFFPKIPPRQVSDCLRAVKSHHLVILKSLDLTRVDQLEAVLEHFIQELFDREFFQKYEALFASLPNPVEKIKKFTWNHRLRMYRVLCLTLPNAAKQSNVSTLFSSQWDQLVAEQIYEVKKLLGVITLFAKENQLTPSAAAIQLSEDSTLDVLIELWESRESVHVVLRELLEDVDSLIDLQKLLPSDEYDVGSPRRK